jgi:hypothetical protein
VSGRSSGGGGGSGSTACTVYRAVCVIVRVDLCCVQILLAWLLAGLPAWAACRSSRPRASSLPSARSNSRINMPESQNNQICPASLSCLPGFSCRQVRQGGGGGGEHPPGPQGGGEGRHVELPACLAG